MKNINLFSPLLIVLISSALLLGSCSTWGPKPGPKSARKPANYGTQDLQCIKDSQGVISFRGIAGRSHMNDYVRLDPVSTIEFESVTIRDGQIHSLSGFFTTHSYLVYILQSYEEDEIEPSKEVGKGGGLYRILNGGRFQILANGGSLRRFRGAPLRSDRSVFDGRWETPANAHRDLTDLMLHFLKVAEQIKFECEQQ